MHASSYQLQIGPDAMEAKIKEAAMAVRRIWPTKARLGLILGTGMGKLASHIEVEERIPYYTIPHFAKSTALSHKGQFDCGRIGSLPVIIMDGRCHVYEGYSLETITLPVRVMRELGAELLIVSCASGGLNQAYSTGDVMIIEDHINLMYRALSSDWPHPRFDQRLLKNGPLYDRKLIKRAQMIALREHFMAHRGVYAAMIGPNYETRAEYRFLRKIGADVVGMSTAPEVTVAVECGMKALGLAIVTNIARPDAPQRVNPEEVVWEAELTEPKIRKIVLGIVREMSGHGLGSRG